MKTEANNWLMNNKGNPLLPLLATFALLTVCSCNGPMDFPLLNPCDPLYQGSRTCSYYQITDTGLPPSDSELDGGFSHGDTGHEAELDTGYVPQDTGPPPITCLDDHTGNPKPGWCLIEHHCYRMDAPNPANPCLQCSPGLSNRSWSHSPRGVPCHLDGDPLSDHDEESPGGACLDGHCVPAGEICPCTEESICCDGCNPINPGTTCFHDDLHCTSYQCSPEGDCEQILLQGWCLNGEGTCSHTSTDPNNCGSCGHSCQDDHVCLGGKCVEDCEEDMTLCGEICVDLQTDPNHCGRCHAPCLEGRACMSGACSTLCAEGLTMCGSTCVNTVTNRNHCGRCFNQCNPGAPCRDSQCINKVTGVSISPDTMSLGVGETAPLEAIFEPAEPTDTAVTWFSANPNTASVSPEGLVTGIGVGLALIRVTTHDGGHMAYANVTVSHKVSGVTLDQEFLQLTVGGQGSLNATVHPPNAEMREVLWSSSLPLVAEVDQQGNVTARSSGQATITATTVDGGFTAQCVVTISDVPVTGISLSPESVVLRRNQTHRLRVTLYPANATIRSIIWSSSAPEVVSIDQNGNIYGLDAGLGVITAQSQDGGFTAICEVAVIVVSVQPDPLHIPLLNDTAQLSPIFNPPHVIDPEVDWSSANPDIASVDPLGVVTGHRLGETEITTVSPNGGHTGTAQVLVGVRVTGVSLSPPLIKMSPAETALFAHTVRPPNATEQEVVWESDDPQVATVDPSTGLITAQGVGTAQITVTTVDRGYTAQGTIVSRILVDDITVSPATHTISVGETAEFTATILPEDATDPRITWRSSAPRVASVNENGLVQGINDGEAIITATAIDDGAVQGAATITILPLVSSVHLNHTSLTVAVDYSSSLVATVLPEAAADKRVEWSTDNDRIATVTQDGLITARGVGATNIRVRTLQGDYTDICRVNVVHYVGSGGYYDPYQTRFPKTSCLQYKNHYYSSSSGYYTINRSGYYITAYCDMTTDGGGYTFVKFTYSGANAAQAESRCRSYGMGLFIPRTQAHFSSAQTFARMSPNSNINYLSIMGIYPKYKGATCANMPLNSNNSQCQWKARDGGRFWVSNRYDIDEPGEDNSTTESMEYTYSYWELTGYKATEEGHSSSIFICDPGDKQ